MTCRRYLRTSKAVCLLPYFLIAFFPVVYLLFTGDSDKTALLNPRRIGLMINSFQIGFYTAVICIVISVFAVLRIEAVFGKKSPAKWFFLASAALPSYIYALSYMNIIRFTGKFMPFILRSRMAGIFPCVLVESMSFLPFALAAALVGLKEAETEEWRSALLFKDPDEVFFRILLPKQLPFLIAMGGVIFVLSVTDYSIPSLFQVNVYAMEIFSDYSASGQSIHSLKLALPLIIASAAMIFLSMTGFDSHSRPMRTDMDLRLEYSSILTGIGNIAFLISLLQIILPILSMIPYLFSLSKEYLSAFEELCNSCISSGLAVLLLLIPSAAAALAASEEEKNK